MNRELMSTLFVFRNKTTGKIRCEFLEIAQMLESRPDEWEHLETINPRLWIEHHWKEQS